MRSFPPDIRPNQARILQRKLCDQVRLETLKKPLRRVCGVDVSGVRSGRATAAAVLLHFPQLTIAEIATAEVTLTFPYRSGLLSFRECPAVLAALEKLSGQPDVLVVDGQGIAHPRRFGLACHLGVELDMPTLGCAKSRLCGHYEDPGEERECHSPLIDKGEVVGSVLRSRSRVKPLFVSPGHRMTLEDAVSLVLACGRGLRIPEPTRLAHQAAADPEAFRAKTGPA